MKLYLFEGRWQVPGQQDKKAERREVPTDTAGLCAFLNNLFADVGEPGCPEEVAPFDQLLDAPAVVELPIHRPVMVEEKQAERIQNQFTTSEIEDFILNRATVAQVGNIFECLGARFAEQRRVA